MSVTGDKQEKGRRGEYALMTTGTVSEKETVDLRVVDDEVGHTSTGTYTVVLKIP